MRTYSGLTPHSLLGGGRGHHQLCLLHGLWCGTSFISLWWLCRCHQREMDSCLAQTSNMVQASLAVPPLKNLHLRCSQMTAARSWVGPYHGSCARDTLRGSRTFSSQDSLSSAVILGCGSYTRLR